MPKNSYTYSDLKSFTKAIPTLMEYSVDVWFVACLEVKRVDSRLHKALSCSRANLSPAQNTLNAATFPCSLNPKCFPSF